jgi:hypothetical protein
MNNSCITCAPSITRSLRLAPGGRYKIVLGDLDGFFADDFFVGFDLISFVLRLIKNKWK